MNGQKLRICTSCSTKQMNCLFKHTQEEYAETSDVVPAVETDSSTTAVLQQQDTHDLSTVCIAFGISGTVTGFVGIIGFESALSVAVINLIIMLSIASYTYSDQILQRLQQYSTMLPAKQTITVPQVLPVPASGGTITTSNSSIAIKEISTALEIVQEALSYQVGQDGWEFHSTQKNVQIWTKKENNCTYVRGETVVDVPLAALLLALKDKSREFDLNLKELRHQETFDTAGLHAQLVSKGVLSVVGFKCLHSRYHRIFPTTARDACVANAVLSMDQGRTMVLSRSLVRSDVPEHRDFVRMNVLCNATVFERIPGTDTTRIRVLAMGDPMGVIPAFVVAQVAPERATLLHRLSVVAKKHYPHIAFDKEHLEVGKDGDTASPSPITVVQMTDPNAENAVAAITKALDVATEALEAPIGQDGWYFHSKQKNVEILMKKEEDLTFVRGDTTVDVPMELLLKTIQTHTLEFDGNMKSTKPMQVFDSELLRAALPESGGQQQQVNYFDCHSAQYHRIFPTTARDACVASAVISQGKNSVLVVDRSVVRADVPEHKDYVRLNVLCNFIQLDRVSTTSTRMRTVGMADPMGAIPSFIVAQVAPERATLLHRISMCAKKHYT